GSAPWSTSGGLRLITTTTVDFMGRPIMVEDANGNIMHTIFDDPNHSIRVYPGWDNQTGATTGPTQVYREDWSHAYTETLTMSATPSKVDMDAGGGVDYYPTGGESISSVESLSRSVLNNAGQPIYADDYSTIGTYSASTVLLTGGGWAHYRSETQ